MNRMKNILFVGLCFVLYLSTIQSATIKFVRKHDQNDFSTTPLMPRKTLAMRAMERFTKQIFSPQFHHDQSWESRLYGGENDNDDIGNDLFKVQHEIPAFIKYGSASIPLFYGSQMGTTNRLKSNNYRSAFF